MMSSHDTFNEIKKQVRDLTAALEEYGEVAIDKPGKRELARIAKLAGKLQRYVLKAKGEE